MVNPSSTVDQNLDLKRAFQRHLPARIHAIEDNWNGLMRNGWDQERLVDLYQRVQDLAGAAGKFGLVQVSEGVFSLELEIRGLLGSSLPSDQQIQAVRQHLAVLSAAAKDSQQPLLGNGVWPQDKRLKLFLLRPEEGLAPDLVSSLEMNNLDVVGFRGVQELLGEMVQAHPAAVVVDTQLLPRLKPLSEALARMKAEGDAPSLILISSDSNLETRLQAMRAGADAFFTLPIDAAAVAARVRELTAADRSRPYRIMVVDDDPSQADFAVAILRKANMETCAVTEPMRVLDALDAFRPDLVLMDIYMPEADGIELTGIIREQNEFIGIPIVFLSGEQDTDKQLDALSVGGDDFIAKPIRPRQLIATIKNRVQRARALRSQPQAASQRDPVTGLFNRRHFFERLDHALAAGGPQLAARGVLYLELDGKDEIRADVGPGHADALMAELGILVATQVEPQDISARLSEDGFVVLAKRPVDKHLVQLAESLVKSVANNRFHVANLRVQPTVSVGLCVIDGGLSDASALLSRASKSCADARSRGGNQVQFYRQPLPEGSGAIDTQAMLALIRDGLRNDSFQVLYQPFVNLVEKKGESYEVTLRLRTEDGDQIAQQDFQPEARQAGLIAEIDRWVLHHALDVLDERRHVGRQVQLLIAQVAETLADVQLAEWLRDQLRRRLLVGTGLILEFNLVDMAVDLKRSRALVSTLRDMGVATCLARFGHNDASYKVLTYLGPSFVKVVDKLLQAEPQVVSSLVRRCHESGVQVIVPRVDDPRQIAEQWLSGADFVQGNAIQGPREHLDYDFASQLPR